jgi:hypothetical protein
MILLENFRTKYKKSWRDLVNKIRLDAVFSSNSNFLDFLEKSEFLKLDFYMYDHYKLVFLYNNQEMSIAKDGRGWATWTGNTWEPLYSYFKESNVKLIDEIFSSFFTSDLKKEGVDFLVDETKKVILASKIKEVDIRNGKIEIRLDNGILLDGNEALYIVKEVARNIK